MSVFTKFDFATHPAYFVQCSFIFSNRIVFANACKRMCDLAAIAKHQVQYTTFESIGELDKIKASNSNVMIIYICGSVRT
jgi:diaminopimelate decarboxylase